MTDDQDGFDRMVREAWPSKARWTAGRCEHCHLPIVAGVRIIRLTDQRGWAHRVCP
jgi:hypothetical protein